MEANTKAWIALSMTMAASIGAGAAIGSETQQNTHGAQENERNEAQSELEDIEQRQVGLDYERDVIAADLGEGCLRLLNEYMPGGDLAGTDENIVVSDLLQAEGLPCGDGVTDVRADVRNLTTVEDSIATNQARSTELNRAIDGQLENSDGDQLGQGEAIFVGGAVGAAIGIGLGYLAGSITYSIAGGYREE